MRAALIAVCVLALGAVVVVAMLPTTDRTANPSAPPFASQAKSDSPPTDDDRPVIKEEPAPTPEGMVWIPGGTFTMGDSQGHQPDERFEHPVTVDGFWMDKTEVTNTQFAEFVKATGYKTEAELPPKLSAKDGTPLANAQIDPELNHPGSICFKPPSGPLDPSLGAYNWWAYIPGTDWRHPEGPDSNIKSRMDHPAVQISWNDAVAYCRWAKKRLPTEAEWEYAARGGLKGQTYPWGNDRNPDGKWLNNIWQGPFPKKNDLTDGYATTAPVASFPANKYGLYDVSGNVWEWCADNYQPDYYEHSPTRNPPGPEESFDPAEPDIAKRIQRGGSFLCSDNYCTAYRVSARMKGDPSSATVHAGFRCVRSAQQ